MENFKFYNPTAIYFGRNETAKISNILPKDAKVLVVYGGGSIKKNGAYEQVMHALKGFVCEEFGGIEPNPEYATCLKAVDLINEKGLNFILAVGGGSVIDGAKFISAAAKFDGDKWDIFRDNGVLVKDALPLATVLTLPATGSEMNMNSVISRSETGEKVHFGSEFVFPKFSILDPTFTLTLPRKQIANGVIDAFIHVMEQYLTFDQNAPLQDRFCESIMRTLYEEGKKAMRNPHDYDVRANIMWSATMALNHLVGMGVVQDWATHFIGHELTAAYGIDHAQTLAIVMPKLMNFERGRKGNKIVKFGKAVFGICDGDKEKAVDSTILALKRFFIDDMETKIELSDYGVDLADACNRVRCGLEKHFPRLGEYGDLTPIKVCKLLQM